MYKDLGKVIIRTPLFSYGDLIERNGTRNFDFEQLIINKLNDPCFIEALYWASPDIYSLSREWKKGLITGKKEQKFLHSVKKYIIRAGSRSTPYGLFAGCDTADIYSAGIHKKKVLTEVPRRKIRLDIRVLEQLVDLIKHEESIARHIHYCANSSLYQIHGHYRYLEYTLQNGQREYQLSSIESSEVLDHILQVSRRHMVSRESILNAIGDIATEEEKIEFIDNLIQSQLLVAEIELGVTEKDQLQKLRSFLEQLMGKNSGHEKYLHLIREIENIIMEFENAVIGQLPIEKIRWLKDQFKMLGIFVEGDIFLQADLQVPNKSSHYITEDIVSELLEATKAVSRFTVKTSLHEQRLKDFKKRFIEKYETQEIPFSEVSDMEMGIGFPVSGPIGNIAHNPYAGQIKKVVNHQKAEPQEKWHAFLQAKTEIVARSDRRGIVLKASEISAFPHKMQQLSNTIAIMFSILPNGQLLLHSAGGATANSLLGRFAYLDENIESLCQRIADEDSRFFDENILVEIAHLPGGKVGNVVRRLNFNDFEIPFLTEPSLDTEQVIPIDDLMISVQYDKIVLRSKRLNKKVVPRLSCAHNYTNSDLSVYHLLCALQHQGKTGVNISFGEWAKCKIFLPRISYGRVILLPATWHFKIEDYGFALIQPNPTDSLKKFLQGWDLPRFIALSDGDNELFLDLNEDSYLQILVEELKKKETVKFIEWLHFDIDDPQSRWVNQFVLPLHKIRIDDEDQPEQAVFNNVQSVSRTFPPGSEWIYFKFYCGAHLSDEILAQLIKPVSEHLLALQLIDQFFFIRYNDPHYHIRYRLHLPDLKNDEFAKVMEYIHQSLTPYIESRIIWKVQLDTYHRELERYGIENITAIEYLFFEDSHLYLSLLVRESFNSNAHIRLLSALKNIDKWLDLFGLELQEKITFTERMANALLKEFGSECKIQVDKQYREMKVEIKEYMEGSEYNELFLCRSKIKTVSSSENLASYIHMSINRWFKTDQRLMEYYAYSFCTKYYKTSNTYILS